MLSRSWFHKTREYNFHLQPDNCRTQSLAKLRHAMASQPWRLRRVRSEEHIQAKVSYEDEGTASRGSVQRPNYHRLLKHCSVHTQQDAVFVLYTLRENKSVLARSHRSLNFAAIPP